ncbi:kinase-like protein [Gigaspora margarita]|uniref:Kinase-like protein n=1 Tax=Gigaspora margarita TaxID=4874 RepID=A0A8H3X9T4_GIGMA|nr:kinase-like protein [Gigaspora margarita]
MSSEYVESPIDIKPPISFPSFPSNDSITSSNKRDSTCLLDDTLSDKCSMNFSTIKNSFVVSKQVLKGLKHEELSAKGLNVIKDGEELVEEIKKLLFKNSHSKEKDVGNQSSEVEKDDDKVNPRFQKFIEESEDFENFESCLWKIGVFISVTEIENHERISNLIDETSKAIDKMRTAIDNWGSTQKGWKLVRSRTLSLARFLSIPKKRFENKHKITESDLSEVKSVRGSKDHIFERFYKKYIRVAEKNIGQDKEALLEELKKEIKFMKELRECSNILEFYGYCRRSDCLFVVTRWVDHNLQTYLTEHRENSNLTLADKLLIARGIANGLDFCHKKDILHYDIRTSNILLDKYLHPKLYNFRINNDIESSSMPNYMLRWSSPERIRGEEYTKASEVYSFALVMWAIEYQQLPFNTLMEEEIKLKILDEERPELTSEDSTLAEYHKIIEKSWSQDPSQRHEMSLILDHLNKLVNTSGQDSDDDSDKITNLDLAILKRKPNRHSPTSPIVPIYNEIEKGIELHNNKKYNDAWEIFQSCYNQKQDDPNTNLWMGIYLIKGYGDVKPEVQRGLKFLKKASELQHPEAQYQYALALLNKPVVFEDGDRYVTAVRYLEKAAKQDHYPALEQWGKIVLRGKYYQKADPVFGKSLIEKANKLKTESRRNTRILAT